MKKKQKESHNQANKFKFKTQKVKKMKPHLMYVILKTVQLKNVILDE